MFSFSLGQIIFPFPDLRVFDGISFIFMRVFFFQFLPIHPTDYSDSISSRQVCILMLVTLDALQCTENVVSYDR